MGANESNASAQTEANEKIRLPMGIRWRLFVNDPKARFKQLQIAVGIFFLGVMGLYGSAELEWQWLFSLSAIVMMFAILMTIPYLSILYWRIKISFQNKTRNRRGR